MLLRTELDAFFRRYGLTTREQDVVYLLLQGQSSVGDIAEILELSKNTVHNHFKKVFRRTKTTNKAALMSLFIRESLGRQAQQQPFLKLPNVLLVGEGAGMRRRLKAGLDQRGMRIFEAQNGEAALAAIAALGIDVVVTDNTVRPGGDALQAQIVHRFGRRPPVLCAESLLDGRTNLGAPEAEGSPANDALVFSILDSFVDSEYERSRLVRVESDLQGRLGDTLEVSVPNLGFGGAFVAIMPAVLKNLGELQPGHPAHLRLRLPGGEQVLSACIAWRRDEPVRALPAG